MNPTDTLETYYRQIKAFPLLTLEDELELSKQIQNGNTEAERQKALHKLVNCNLRLVVKIARMFNIPDVHFLDMVQEGNLGLIQAAKKYDYRKNIRFSTYASYWVRQFINRFISSKHRIIRLPLRKEETIRKIQKTHQSLTQTLMRQPQNSDIAEELGISVRDVDSIVKLAAKSLSLEPSIRGDAGNGSMDIHEDYTYCPENNLLKKFSQDGTMRVLNKLKKREKHVLSYRYQLDGCKHCTLKEIGDELDISPETVRQIEIRALEKIRTYTNELKECVYVEAI